MYYYRGLPTGCADLFPLIDQLLSALGVPLSYQALPGGGRIYRIPTSHLPCLPADGDDPLLPIAPGDGFRLVPEYPPIEFEHDLPWQGLEDAFPSLRV